MTGDSMTKAELRAEFERCLAERQKAVERSSGIFGEAPGIEAMIRLLLDDTRMFAFLTAKIIELLPDDRVTPMTAGSQS